MSKGGKSRSASVERKTGETDVRVALDLDGSGAYEISTGIAFFDHMNCLSPSRC